MHPCSLATTRPRLKAPLLAPPLVCRSADLLADCQASAPPNGGGALCLLACQVDFVSVSSVDIIRGGAGDMVSPNQRRSLPLPRVCPF